MRGQGRSCGSPMLVLLVALAACRGSAARSEVIPVPPPPPDSGARAVDTVRIAVTDPELEQRATRLALQLLEKEAEVEELESRLDEARREVVRSMAKLRTLATRAEAASAMAEAEIALQSLRSAAGSEAVPELEQAKRLLDMSAAEFNQQNYGGALYLANQAKAIAVSGTGRWRGADRVALRPGEARFALPLRLTVTGRTNLREGPGTGYRILVTLDAGAPLTGVSYVGEWVRVVDEAGRGGWVIYSRVARRGP